MEKYLDQLKADLNKGIEKMLSGKKSIKLKAGQSLDISRVGTVSMTGFSELKLIDFIGGRKFEADGEGVVAIWVKTDDGDIARQMAFRITNALVDYDDAVRQFKVIQVGEFTALDFVKDK